MYFDLILFYFCETHSLRGLRKVGFGFNSLKFKVSCLKLRADLDAIS